jgi:iron complex outermembrane receptor protein
MVSAMLSLGAIAGFLTSTGKAQTTTTTTTTTTDTAAEPTQVLQAYTVTGSYLPVTSTVNASPVVTIQSSDIGQSGATDPLRLLRQLTPFFSGNGNVGTELNNAGSGESNVALRNLPTLVLLNGQRLVPSANSSGNAVDLNTIPVNMIDHIDILKDGASTIYGSDAIGGVVNVVLKKNFNGFEAGYTFGASQDGAYKTTDAYIMGGASGPGYTLVVSAEHFQNSALVSNARPLSLLVPAQINALGYNVTSSVYSGSYPGRVGSDLLAGASNPAGGNELGAAGYNAAITSPTYKYGVAGEPYGTAPQTLAQLVANGTYLVAANAPDGIAAGGATDLNTTLLGNNIITPTKRNEFTANFDRELIGKNLEAYGDMLFSQTTNTGTGLAPSPISSLQLYNLTVPANNPYNPFGTILGIGAPAGTPTVRSRMIEFGNRAENDETNTWRVVTGLKGEIGNWTYDASFNYSRSSATDIIIGGANGLLMNEAMVPELNAARNGYVYDPATGRPLSILTDSSGNNVPVYNILALPGFNDPRTLAAITTDLFNTAQSDLKAFRYVVTGKPFTLPAGDLGVAAGYETYREDIGDQVDGIFSSNSAVGYEGSATFGGGSRSTRGEFAEVGIPVFSPSMKVPGAYSLDLNVAERFEQIQPGGNANTPKVGVKWLPFDDQFALRATWSKGFIAPSIYNLFGPPGESALTYTLPEGNGGSGSGGTVMPLVPTTGQWGNPVILSNPKLQASNSKSYTIGGVISPKYIKGLNITVDYYHISEDRVGSIDLTTVFQDLNAKGSASIYAPGFSFADGTVLKTTAANQINTTNAGTINIANNPTGDQWTDGVDVDVDYAFATDMFGRFDVGISANYLMNYKYRATATDAYLQYANQFTDSTTGGSGYEGLLPRYLLKPYINNTYKWVSTSIYMNYIPQVNVPGSSFPTPANISNYGTGPGSNYYTLSGNPSKTPSYFTMDLAFKITLPTFGFTSLRNSSVTLGANNVFNKAAPYIPGDGSYVAENNTDKGAYDIIGRFLFVSLKKDF